MTTTTTVAPPVEAAARRLWLPLLGFIALCAIGFRWIDIGFSLDGDEAFSVSLAIDSWSGTIARSLADKPHPPLHNVLLHAWLSLWGISETSARALSVLMSVASIVIMMSMLRGLVRPTALLTAGLVMASSGFLIYYGQQARPYGLVALVGTLNLLAFRRLLARPGEQGRVLAWAITALFIGFTHYVGAVFLVIEACLVFLWLERRSWLRVLGPAVVGAACVLPWMWAAFHENAALDNIDWIERPDLRTFALFYVRSFGRPEFMSNWIFVPVLALLAAAGAWRFSQSGRDRHDVMLFAVLAFAPAIVCFALSQVLEVSIWAPRQMILSAMAFIALLAILVDSLPRRASLAGSIALIAWTVAGASEGFGSTQKPDWRLVVDRIETADANATILSQEQWTLTPLLYYADSASVQSLEQTPPGTPIPAHSYFVCRPSNCDDLSHLQRTLGPAQEIARDEIGGDQKRVVLTYRFAGTTLASARFGREASVEHVP